MAADQRFVVRRLLLLLLLAVAVAELAAAPVAKALVVFVVVEFVVPVAKAFLRRNKTFLMGEEGGPKLGTVDDDEVAEDVSHCSFRRKRGFDDEEKDFVGRG